MNGKTAIFGTILGLAVAGGTAPRAGAQAPPGGQASAAPRTENAKVEQRGVAGSLAQTVDAWAAGADRPAWLAYSVPAANADRQSCCGDGNWNNHGSCGPCKLEGSQHGGFNLRSDKVDLEGPRKILVLFRAEGRKIGKIRTVSDDCTLDAGGLEMVWLADVNPRESVRYLERFVNGQEFDDHARERLGRGALGAIALHGDPAADEALTSFASSGKREEMRKEAAFWSGAARGAAGLALLKRMAAGDPSPEVRAHVTFALSISREPDAVEEMIRMAHQDSSGHVRGQALFWLAQKAGNKAAAAITGAIDNDPDTEVKTKAVFALSQMPKEEGVPKLIDVAQRNRNPEVRKQAMFWLGQSNDPRALDFFEKVLSK
jgi:HEAT repeats/PBS lyase HEAT-like repeat